jgi:hypothetical protein
VLLSRLGQAFGICRCEVNDQTHQGDRFVLETEDSDAAYLEQAGKGLGRAHQQPAAGGFEMDPVVGDQSRKRQYSCPRRIEKFKRET